MSKIFRTNFFPIILQLNFSKKTWCFPLLTVPSTLGIMPLGTGLLNFYPLSVGYFLRNKHGPDVSRNGFLTRSKETFVF